jgi:hypothetical protein
MGRPLIAAVFFEPLRARLVRTSFTATARLEIYRKYEPKRFGAEGVGFEPTMGVTP